MIGEVVCAVRERGLIRPRRAAGLVVSLPLGRWACWIVHTQGCVRGFATALTLGY